MNENTGKLSEIYSFHLHERLQNKTVDLNKKRKLQAEQLDLPIPKHKCWDRSFASEPVSVFRKSPEVESMFTNIITKRTEGTAMDDESEPESAKDSNSFGGDSDSAMSPYAKTNLFDRASTSSVNYDSNDFKYADYSSGFRKDKLAFLGGEHPTYHDGLQAFQNLEEHLLEVSNQVDHTCSEYGNDSLEQCTDKELEDILYSNGVNPTMYVLSSGRWTVNQEVQSSTRKPTIDQEFEQYFSKLML